MVDFAVTVNDSDLLALLRQVNEQFTPAGQQRILAAWVEEMVALDLFAVPYPPQSNAPLPEIYSWGDGKLHKFKSLHAQRGFFAALRSGDIDIPYNRTRALEHAPDVTLQFAGGYGVVLVELPESQRRGKRFDPKWVIGSESQQTYYFKTLTGWVPYERTLEQRQERMEAVGATVLENILTRIDR